MPPRPSAAETAPSCMTPPPDRSGSSSWRAIVPPQSRWYWSARRMMPGAGDRQAVVGEGGRAGLAQLAHLGQLLAPHADGHGGDEADRDRCLGAGLLAQRADIGGGRDRRLGVGHREDPAVAARRRGAVPVSMSSLCSWPGVRRWTWGSKNAGKACRPAASITSAPLARHRAGSGQLGDPATADHQVVDALDPGRRVEHASPPAGRGRGLPGAHVERLGQAHAAALWESGARRRRPRPAPAVAPGSSS